MKFQFTEKKVSLPESVHAYAEKKVMKLERFFRDDAEALVTFSVEKDRNKAEITVHAAGTYFRASEATSDMYASIDAAVATIERQIRKNKTRLARRLRQDAFVRQPDVTSFAVFSFSSVARKRQNITRLLVIISRRFGVSWTRITASLPSRMRRTTARSPWSIRETTAATA